MGGILKIPTRAEIQHIERDLRSRDLYDTVREICRNYNVTFEAVIGKKRSDRVVQARDAVFHRLRRLGFSHAEIGMMLGYNHGSVLAGVARYTERDNGKLLR